MKIDSLKAILHSLNKAIVRYLIAGGVAVNIHGYQRLTHDLDLVIQFVDENVKDALIALDQLGYHPNIPVEAYDFVDTEIRKDWIESKNMQVFSMVSEAHRETTVDIFVSEPFDFADEYNLSPEVQLDDDLSVRLVSIPTLIEMKKRAGRDRDKDDVQHLMCILEEHHKDV